MADTASRDYHAEIATAAIAGDLVRMTALASELAGKVGALEQRRASDRARKERQRHVTSREVPGQAVTSQDSPSAPSPQGSPSFPTPHITPPSPSSPTTPKKPGAAKAPRPPKPEPVEAAPKGYVALAVDAWNGRYGAGSASGGKIAGALGQLVRAGHPEALVVERWERFVASDDSKYGPEYFKQHFADFAERPTEGRPAEIPAADMGRARSCGAVVESAFRDRGIDRQSSTWWQRIVADAKRLNRHPSVLAFEQLHTLPSLTTSNGNGTHA